MTIVLDGSSGITAPGGTAAAPSITTTGDVNTGIFFPAADTIAFSEGGVESMRIDSSANVGIGTVSPSSKLDLVGVLQWQATAGTVLGKLTYSGGEPVVLANTGLGLRFFTNNTQTAILDSSGILGLGVTPSAFAGAGKYIQFGNGSASIGTQNSGDANFMHNAYESPAGTFKYVASGVGALRYQLDINNNVHKWYYAASGTANNTITFTQAMTLDASGNLGIGTTAPWSQVSMSTPSGGTTGYFGVKDSVYGGDVRFGKASGINNNAIAGAFSNNDFLLYSNSIERARIGSGGELLVGTTSALANGGRFQLLGVALAAAANIQVGTNAYPAINFNNAGGVQQGYIVTNAASVAYTSISDYRLKNTIAPMTGALAKVALLKPVTYKWNADGSDGQGFIAHELAEVVPDCVTGEKDAVDVEGNPRYQGVDTSFLVATLTAAIQELTARVAQLESK